MGVRSVSLAAAVQGLPLSGLVDEYITALEVAGRSRRTIEWYRVFLDEFVAFCPRRSSGGLGGPHAGDSPTVIARHPGNEASTPGAELFCRPVRTLRAFAGWVQRELQLGTHPLAGLPIPKVPDVLVPSLTDAELRALLDAVEKRSTDPIRDRAILLLLLDSRIRLGELIGLSVGDVDLAEGRCRVMGKGAKQRIVPIGGRTRRAIRASLLARGQVAADDLLFIGRRGDLLMSRAVQKVVRRLAHSAGLSRRCSPHVLRHSFARAFLANGGDVFSLQRILGHSPSSLQITRRHVRLLDDDLREVHRRVSPADRL